MARPRSRLLDLERDDVLSGDRLSVATHAIFVWPVFLAAILLLHLATPSPHAAGVCAALYGAYYLLLDRRAGALAALLCLICWAASGAVADRLGFSTGRTVVLVTQLLCWAVQFVGHKSFEKRVPRSVGNLAQSFLMVPFFVLLEVVHSFTEHEETFARYDAKGGSQEALKQGMGR